MVFSSPIFLFLFLPITLAVCFVLPARLRNVWLLGASLLFYGWGEPKFLFVMLASIAVNHLLALRIAAAEVPRRRKLLLTLAVGANLGLLVVFKYTNFLVDNLNATLEALNLNPPGATSIALPLGISFFTFQALSYVIDVYRRETPVQRNPLDLGLYIAFFPQLIAGPIVRYHDIARQLVERVVTREGFAYGVRRFVVGLGKKVLIANTLAVQADLIFSLPADQLTPAVAWLGLVCYTLQIYFDFSGYSDMAIGLACMFGFRFNENFSYPYIAQSITEFWRRWHISLSTWFRDYLYIPLGGNRVAPWRVYVNLLIVFMLCGFWHGASWNFLVWGLLHGSFLVIERMGLANRIVAWARPLRHLYALLVVMVGWVFFRADTLPEAWGFLMAMSGVSRASGVEHSLALYLDAPTLLAIAAGVVGSTPIATWMRQRMHVAGQARQVGAGTLEIASLSLILGACAMLLAAGTYNPFIYFRF